MRSLAESRQRWGAWKEVNSLQGVRESLKTKNTTEPKLIDLRSICWKVFLLFKSVNQATWMTALAGSRDGYGALRAKFLKIIEHPNEIESAVDPLSDNQDSPWAALRQDEALQSEIFQDVERCMPDNLYFQEVSTQKMLLDILFVFCKLNPDIGYRQGMHEVLAPVLWVVERDAIDLTNLEKAEEGTETSDTQLKYILNSVYIEHDTFTIFNVIMQSAKVFYETRSSSEVGHYKYLHQDILQSVEIPIVARSNRIFYEYLPRFDPGLAAHLKSLNISPQIFLMKWIRLLFGREFPLDDVFTLWDLLFAEDPSLELVDMICVAMILRIRWKLVGSGVNSALDLLLHYPQPSSDHSPQSFVIDAIYLRQNMSSKNGNVIIRKYSGKAPVLDHEEENSGTSTHEPTTRSSIDRHTSKPEHSRVSPNTGNLEYYLQDAARGLYSRSRKLGIRKAVQDAVGEVRKNVQAITLPEGEGRLRQARNNQGSAGPADILQKISALQERNKALARMLASAVDELWEYEKDLNSSKNGKSENKNGSEGLSATIAKVQFVQVFMEDPSIEVAITDVAEDKSSGSTQSTDQESSQGGTGNKGNSHDQEDSSTKLKKNNMQPKPSIISDNMSDQVQVEPESATLDNVLSATNKPSPNTDSQETITSEASAQSHKSRTPVNLHASRPSLAQSSFSWMVKTDTEDSSFVATSPTPTERRRGRASRGFLFGEDDGADKAKTESVGSGGGSSSTKGKTKPEVIGLDALK